MWGGRFKKPLLPELDRFQSSLDVDVELAPYDLMGSLAHARGLHAAGLLTALQLSRLEKALDRIAKEVADGEFHFAQTDEDVHTAMERRLAELDPDGASRLHAGRSRNDQVALDLRLYCRFAVVEMMDGLAGLIEALAKQAGKHAGWPMPGYTHLQRAQPVTVGHHLLAHAEPLLRDSSRLLHAYLFAGDMPLGSAALAGSTLPLDRQLVARELGFAHVTNNSIDAVSDRDFALDLVYACSSIGIHLSRLGEDVVLWSTSEFGFVRLADEVATGSSIMPQKRNPDIAELLRARVGRALGALVALATVLKGLPLAYDKDLQEDKTALFAAVENCIDCLEAARLLVEHLEFDRRRLEAAVADPDLLATDTAEQLVAQGRPFREVHAEVGRAVLEGTHQPPWDAATSLAKRDLVGAPNPKRVAAEARRVRREAVRLRKWAERDASR
jgi:argininosuccinate lyase